MEGSGVEKDPSPRGNGMSLITHEVNREISPFFEFRICIGKLGVHSTYSSDNNRYGKTTIYGI